MSARNEWERALRAIHGGRATLPEAKPEGCPRSGCAEGPWMGRLKSIGNVEIPQAELQSGREWTGLNVLSRAKCPAQRGFLAILKVGDD